MSTYGLDLNALVNGRYAEITDANGNEYRLYYEVDPDMGGQEGGPFPYMLRFSYEGFPWDESRVPQRIRDRLIAIAYGQIRGDTE